jgi:hypothetical protein
MLLLLLLLPPLPREVGSTIERPALESSPTGQSEADVVPIAI